MFQRKATGDDNSRGLYHYVALSSTECPALSWIDLRLKYINMSLILRNSVFQVSDQVTLKPASSASETNWRIGILDIETRNLLLSSFYNKGPYQTAKISNACCSEWLIQPYSCKLNSLKDATRTSNHNLVLWTVILANCVYNTKQENNHLGVKICPVFIKN